MFPCNKYLGCNPTNNEIYSKDGELEYWICEDCNLIWRSSNSMHITKDYGQTYFDSKKYASKRKHKVKKSGWLLDIALGFKPHIVNMLEIGCSLGYTLEAAKQRNIIALGTDISKYAVNYCCSLGLNAENKSNENLLNEQQSFDLIFMQHVLEHFPDPFEILFKCNQLLNKNGLIFLMVPNSNYRNAKKLKEQHRYYSINSVGSEHYVYFNYTNLNISLQNTGFKPIQNNYPSLIKGKNNPEFLVNRIFRKSLSLFDSDQELLLVAQKI
ncbi:MAG: class I SAM-dependent methyltransferase [Mariniphaga sp.]|nr:class I SAM-dependent methyltransferase [Mariniphaga sp.]